MKTPDSYAAHRRRTARTPRYGCAPPKFDGAPGFSMGRAGRSLSALTGATLLERSVAGAIVRVCREAGVDSAEVSASLGSTTGAVFTRGTAPWPAVEFTHLRGSVSSASGENPRVHLEGEVVDVAGDVHSGVLAAGANLVAVTFELFIRRS